MKKALLVVFVGVMAVAGCTKDKGINANTLSKTTTTTTAGSGTVTSSGTSAATAALNILQDSVYLYFKEEYYWNTVLPDMTTFAPHSFTGTTDVLALKAEVNKLSQYKINPVTNLPYEYVAASPGTAKYAFIDQGQIASKLNATTGDFGFGYLYNAVNDLRVSYVTPGSPAANAGLKRGYQIKSVNGSTAISYDGATNTNNLINAVNGSTITLVVTKYDGTSATVTLNAAAYTNTPVLFTNVIDLGNGKKVGYLVFNSFVTLATTKANLDAAFATFQTAGVTDLIVDMRYNGGGYVETAQYLDNLIAPASTSGQVMYNTTYNSILQSATEQLLKFQLRKDVNSGQIFNYTQLNYSAASTQVKFGTAHPLSLNRVFFLVTGSTASAAELAINNLRPFMNVQIVGATTYGKPIGFIDININKYTMYVPAFETTNSINAGAYYSGMKPGSADFPGALVADDLTKDFGDTNEKMLASTLSYVRSGVYTTGTNQVQSLANTSIFSIDQQAASAAAINRDKFTGMLLSSPLHR